MCILLTLDTMISLLSEMKESGYILLGHHPIHHLHPVRTKKEDSTPTCSKIFPSNLAGSVSHPNDSELHPQFVIISTQLLWTSVIPQI